MKKSTQSFIIGFILALIGISLPSTSILLTILGFILCFIGGWFVADGIIKLEKNI